MQARACYQARQRLLLFYLGFACAHFSIRQRVLSVSGVADAIHIATYYIGNILIEANERMPSLTYSSYRPSSYTRRPAWMPSSYVPGYSNPYMNSPPPPPQPNPSQQHQLQTQQIFIPNDLVGCIIGKGGSKINEIRHMSASQIKIMEPGATSTGVNGGPAPTGGEGERLVVITGPPANIQMAVQLLYHVRVRMLTASSPCNSPLPTASGARETKANSSRIECMISLRIERANGHLFTGVFFSFSLPTFSHVAACSPTCFFRLA